MLTEMPQAEQLPLARMLKPDLIEEDIRLLQSTNISSQVLHLMHLQLRGIWINNGPNHRCAETNALFGEIHLCFPNSFLNRIAAVPRKIPVLPKGQSPYTLKNGSLYWKDQLIFDQGSVREIPLSENKLPRYLKGYSFPFLGTENPYYELRINPKNTGRCPGRCLFCHRSSSYHLKPKHLPNVLAPVLLVEAIVEQYGQQVLNEVSHISVITELFGNENNFLSYIEELRDALITYGFRQEASFRTCSQDVRSKDGLKRLKSIIGPARYSFTLEIFSQREKIMGGYKGIDLGIVEEVLKNAKEVGFREIKLNYVAGIDSIESFQKGVSRLSKSEVFDSIGLSVFTAFSLDQLDIRHPDAWQLSYYIRILEVVNAAGIDIYEPTCFEMGFPVQFFQADLPWMKTKYGRLNE